MVEEFYKPKISIIVPMYNSEHTISRCIESIQKQTLSDFELILVNDGSTDDTLNLCIKYSNFDSRIVIVTQENKGLIAARKLGIENANADIVGFVDSDDWIEKDMYENLYAIYSKYNTDLVSSGIFRDYIQDGYTKEVLDNFQEGYYDEMKESVYPTMLWNKEINDFGIYCTLCNKIFKRKILSNVYEYIDDRVFYGEDSLAFYSYMMKCNNVYICKKAFYHYIISGNSMCSSVDERLPMNTYYLYKGLDNVFNGYGELTYKLLEQLKYYIINIESNTLMKLYNISMISLMGFEFENSDIIGKNIVLYGAGGSSRALYNYLIEDCKCKIIAWVDKYPEGKDKLCLHKIESREVINKLNFDYIVISVLSEDLYISIKRELEEMYSIAEEKIIWKKIRFKKFRI